MYKINLVIADEDFKYVELLSQFISESENASKFIIKFLSNKERLNEYLEEKKDTDILLISPKLLPLRADTIEPKIIQLYDFNDKVSTQYNAIAKYQPLDKLISHIISTYLDEQDNLLNINDQAPKTRIVSIYSTVSGSGKTTLALNLAKELGLRDYKIFYLNLEYISSIGAFCKLNNNYDLSKIIYYLNTDQSQLHSRIKEFTRCDETLGIDYFEPVIDSRELLELSSANIEVLLQTLINLQLYDYLIIDLDSYYSEQIVTIFEKSNLILWILLDNFIYKHKTEQMIKLTSNVFAEEYETIKRKQLFLLNKYLGEKKVSNYREYNIVCYLPYIPEWKQINNFENLISSNKYNITIQKLITDYL